MVRFATPLEIESEAAASAIYKYLPAIVLCLLCRSSAGAAEAAGAGHDGEQCRKRSRFGQTQPRATPYAAACSPPGLPGTPLFAAKCYAVIPRVIYDERPFYFTGSGHRAGHSQEFQSLTVETGPAGAAGSVATAPAAWWARCNGPRDWLQRAPARSWCIGSGDQGLAGAARGLTDHLREPRLRCAPFRPCIRPYPGVMAEAWSNPTTQSILRTDAADVLFHIVNARHLRRPPMLFTTNKPPLPARGDVLDHELPEAIQLSHLDFVSSSQWCRGSGHRSGPSRQMSNEDRSRERTELLIAEARSRTGFGLRLMSGRGELLDQGAQGVGAAQTRDLVAELEVVEDVLHVGRERVEVRMEVGGQLLAVGRGRSGRSG